MNKIFYALCLLVAALAALLHPALPVLIALAMGVCIWLLKKPLNGIWLLILFIPAGQLARLPITQQGAQEIALMINDVFIPLLVILWWIKKTLRKEPFVFPPMSWLIFAFSCICIGSLLLASLHFGMSTIMTATLYLIRWLEYASLFFLAFDMIKQQADVIKTMWVVVIAGIGIALFGFIQYYVFPDFSFMVPYGWDPHLERLVSTFFDPNFTGMFLVIILTLLLSMFYHKPVQALQLKDKKIKAWTREEKKNVTTRILFTFLLTALGLPLALALVLTYSRSAMLALALVLVFLGLVKDKKLIVATVVAALMVLAIFPRFQERLTETFDARTSANKRIESWTNALTILQDTNPVIGIGYNTYRATQIEYDFITEEELARSGAGTDSSLLLILVTTGLLGFGIYSVFIIQGIRLGYAMYKNNKYYLSALGLTYTATIIALLAHSQFVNSLLYPFIMIFFWVGLGIVTRFSKLSSKKCN